MKVLLTMVVFCIAQIATAQTYSTELLEKANGGDIKAQRDLGYCLMYGKGIVKNRTKALFWTKKSADNGYAVAEQEMGSYYYYGEEVEKDMEKAVLWYTKAANHGNSEAQCNLGYCYLKGEGVPEDWKESVKWFLKAAEQNHPAAQCNLGICYGGGFGVQKDIALARSWFKKAVSNGDDDGLYLLGRSYAKEQENMDSMKEAVKYFQLSADKGNEKSKWNLPIAQMRLAQTYTRESNINWEKVFLLMKTVTENKDNVPVGAMRGIALLYETFDKYKDLSKSKYWKERAEEEVRANGNVSMQYK